MGYHQGRNLYASSESIMVPLFLTLLWAPVYFQDSINSQLRPYQVPGAGDFAKGDKLANCSSSRTTDHLDR